VYVCTIIRGDKDRRKSTALHVPATSSAFVYVAVAAASPPRHALTFLSLQPRHQRKPSWRYTIVRRVDAKMFVTILSVRGLRRC